MGMPVRALVRDAGFAAARLDPVFAWLRFVDRTFSTYDRTSEICRIRRGVLSSAAADPAVREVLDRCAVLREETGGAFDACARGPLDPTGLVKGWAVERAGQLLDADDFCLDAGGDVLVRGGPWRVGVRHPRRRGKLAAVLALRDAAVATSGAYERGPHIADPATGRPAAGALSVTIVGPDLGTADAYATAAFALGARGPAWTATLTGYAAMTIVPGDRVLATPGFVARCAGPTVGASVA